jgi:hypothetical protein
MKSYALAPAAFVALTSLLASFEARADLVFSENVGAPRLASPIGSYSGWQNNATLTYSGTGEVNSATPSTGYAGSSAGGNVFLTNTGATTFQISSINTSAFDPTFTLSFGAFKSTIASDMSELALAFSSDGIAYTPITIPAQLTGTGTDVWRLITLNNITLPTVSDLRLRWTNTSTTPAFRLDDIALNGTLSAIPETSAFLAVGLAGFVGVCWKRTKHSAVL